jgi:drug/metabolite transporter (DMT)-like permease
MVASKSAPGRLTGAFLIAVSAASFGGLAIFAKLAYADGADTSAVLFLRFLLGGVAMAACVARTGARWPRGRNLALLMAMGGVGYVGQSACYFLALRYASAGLVALLLYLYPALVAVLATLFLRERMTWTRGLAVATALVGTGLTIGGSVQGSTLGVALGIGAALIYSVYITVGGRIMREEASLPVSAVVMLSAAAVWGGVALAYRPAFPSTSAGWLAVVAMALVSTVVGITAFFAGMRRLGAGLAAALSTLEPVVTTSLAALFLGEAVSTAQVVGGSVILASVIALSRS